MSSESGSAREEAIRELVALRWGRDAGHGQSAAAAGHLLAHLQATLGGRFARKLLVGLALQFLLREDFGGGCTPPGELADPRLAAAAAAYRPDEEAVVRECTAGHTAEELRDLLAEVRAEYA
jgi:hypothetical protein